MGKKVLTRSDLECLYFSGSRVLLLERGCIVPPGVADLAKSLGVRLVVFGTPAFEEALRDLLSKMGLSDPKAIEAVLRRVEELLEGGGSGERGSLELEG